MSDTITSSAPLPSGRDKAHVPASPTTQWSHGKSSSAPASFIDGIEDCSIDTKLDQFKAALRALRNSLEAFLFRPEREFDQGTKVEVIALLRNVISEMFARYLEPTPRRSAIYVAAMEEELGEYVQAVRSMSRSKQTNTRLHTQDSIRSFTSPETKKYSKRSRKEDPFDTQDLIQQPKRVMFSTQAGKTLADIPTRRTLAALTIRDDGNQILTSARLKPLLPVVRPDERASKRVLSNLPSNSMESHRSSTAQRSDTDTHAKAVGLGGASESLRCGD